MTLIHKTFRVKNDKSKPAFYNVTEQVKSVLAESRVANGMVLVYSQHTTCSVVIQEESHDTTLDGTQFLMQDLSNVFEKIAPKCQHDGQYLHPGPKHLAHAVGKLGEEGWWSLNTDAHLRSCLLGRSQVIPVVDKAMVLGQFGQIYFIDFDTVRQRERTVFVQVQGE